MHHEPATYSGPHADLVNEVVDFAFGSQIFAATIERQLSFNVTIVHDIKIAIAFTHQTESSRFRIEIEEYKRLTNYTNPMNSELTLDWGSLQQHMISKCIWTTESQSWRKVHAAQIDSIARTLDRPKHFGTTIPSLIYHLRDRIHTANPHISEEDGDVVIEWTFGNLNYCAENRAYNGLVDNYWERLFQIYQMGLWPCGWTGQWPQPGNFIAWKP